MVFNCKKEGGKSVIAGCFDLSVSVQMFYLISELTKALKWGAYNNTPNDKARIGNTKRVLAMIENF